MAEVISLDEKLQRSAAAKAAADRKRKLHAVGRLYRLDIRPDRCQRCHLRLNDGPAGGDDLLPYRFCANCAEEYSAYIRRLQGKQEAGAYWRNHQWMRCWRAWIDYQGAVDAYVRSPEFRQLVKEVHSDPAP